MLNFSIEVDIDKSRTDVVAAMHPDNMSKWAPGFLGMKHISGVLWEEGSKYELRFKTGKMEYKVIETFVTRQFPESFSCVFEEANSVQTSENWLNTLPNKKTRWISKQSLKGTNLFSAFMMRVTPWIFKRHVKKSMLSFKHFAESN